MDSRTKPRHGTISTVNIGSTYIKELYDRLGNTIATFVRTFLRVQGKELDRNPLDIFADVEEILANPFIPNPAWAMVQLIKQEYDQDMTDIISDAEHKFVACDHFFCVRFAR